LYAGVTTDWAWLHAPHRAARLEGRAHALAGWLSQIASCGIGAFDAWTEPGSASAATEMAAHA